jgi:hypothetical protein
MGWSLVMVPGDGPCVGPVFDAKALVLCREVFEVCAHEALCATQVVLKLIFVPVAVQLAVDVCFFRFRVSRQIPQETTEEPLVLETLVVDHCYTLMLMELRDVLVHLTNIKDGLFQMESHMVRRPHCIRRRRENCHLIVKCKQPKQPYFFLIHPSQYIHPRLMSCTRHSGRRCGVHYGDWIMNKKVPGNESWPTIPIVSVHGGFQ